jgi:hypothetical protein
MMKVKMKADGYLDMWSDDKEGSLDVSDTYCILYTTVKQLVSI